MNSSGDITKCVVPSRHGGLELQHHLARSVALHALVGQGWAGDVTVQLFPPLALIGRAMHRRVPSEAGQKGPEMALCLPNAGRRYEPAG
jgi:hypothetical protein